MSATDEGQAIVVPAAPSAGNLKGIPVPAPRDLTVNDFLMPPAAQPKPEPPKK